ncbi:MAG: DHH family phosphoesterase [Flavobacteriales bacterium]|jgi:phosphoesterase RecJ-like protein
MAIYLNAEQVAQSQELILGANRIVITSHKSPDGDAVGSALGLYHVLKSMKDQVTVVLPDSVPDYLHWISDYNKIIFFDSNKVNAQEAIDNADLIFVLDYNIFSRTGEEMSKALESASANFILIDHHQQPGDFAKVTYSDTSACSTCEMIYRFVRTCDWLNAITSEAAEAIYCGIMTDSGSFRFPSVTPETHQIVADLIANGLDHAKIHRAVYDTNLLDRLRLIGYSLSEKLEVWPNAGTAIITLTKEELERFHHRPGDTEGLVNQALSIKGVKVAVFAREGHNEIKLSFRSKGSFDVNTFARNGWNGGGHRNAAGGSSSDDMTTTINRLKTAIMAVKQEIINS